MKNRKLNRTHYGILFFLIICLVSVNLGFGCTIFVKANKDIILVGNNEDYLEKGTRIWFFPKTSGSYGRVIWGYDRYLSPYQGGMNDQGLFVDINAIPHGANWVDDPAKPNLQGDYIEYILVHCATVEDVVNLCKKYDLDLGWIKLVIADARGKSAIIEWLNGKVNVIYRKEDYQVSTNYTSPREHTEIRNQIACEILKSQKNPSVDLMRKVLAATSYDISFGQTMYSTICDLKNRKFYLYHFHYFEEVVEFDLDEELKKGEASYRIRPLFKIRTQNEYFYHGIGPIIGAADLKERIEEDGIDKAVLHFPKMKKKKYRPESKYIFEEWRIRSLGLSYLNQKKFKESIGLFKLIAKEFPKSSQPYSDLGDAYLKAGNRKLAIINYQKVLELDPGNKKIQKILKQLKR